MPRRLAFRELARRAPGRALVEHEEVFVIDERFRVVSHLVTFDGCTGGAASLILDDELELMRIDIHGAQPHIHLNMATSRTAPGAGRLALEPAPPAALVEVMHWHLLHNLELSLHFHLAPDVQQHQLPAAEVRRVADAVRAHQRRLLPHWKG